MKTYKFGIKWEDGYPPSELLSTYHDKYSKLTPYEISIKCNSAKTAKEMSEAFIKCRLLHPVKFELVRAIT